MVSLRFVLAACSVLACLSETSTLTFDVAAAKNRPVTKVVTLLKDMLKQLEKEGEEDEAIYDKLACWCETNDKEKTKSIADAESHITSLTTAIEEGVAESARLNAEIENLNKEVAGNSQALAEATSLREKQLAEFNGEEKDLLESISALKSAVVVLSKHHSASLVQIPRSHILGVAATLSHELETHKGLLQGVLTHSERKAIGAFIQAPEDYFDASPTFKQSYAPQSGEIFGILKQMLETFESNLSSSQKDELDNQKAYADLKAAKEDEINAGQAQADTKTDEKATEDQNVARDKEDVADTKVSLSADENFLGMLKEKCSVTDKEWEMRQKARQEEMEACSKALALLSSDDAHDLFTRTFNPSFVQESSSSSIRARAVQVLARAGQKLHSPRLVTLATRLKLDAFTRVKAAIDDMIAELLKEKDDEIKHKDFCIKEFNANEGETAEKNRNKEDAIAAIETHTAAINTLKKAIDELKSEIAESQTQLKRAGENRERENKEFQTTIADQRATQKLLKQATQVLKGVYEKAFLQQEPPAGFERYEKNKASGGVIGMLEQIIFDAKAMESDCIHGEEEAQRTYEEVVKETNTAIVAKQTEIVTKTETLAEEELEKQTQEKALKAAMTELEQLGNVKADLHSSCDFVINNFEIRQTARDDEVQALRDAKAILSGAKFGDFLQN